MITRAVRFRFLVWLVPALLGAGCGPSGEVPDPAVREDSESDGERRVRSEVIRGPVRVVLEIEPPQPRLSDELTLRLVVDAEERVEVELPPFGDSIGGFLVRSFREGVPVIEDGRRSLSQTYQLEPRETGEHVIRPVTITFRIPGETGERGESGEEGDLQEHQVETEPLTVVVASFLEGKQPSLDDLRPAADPLPIEVERESPWNLALVLLGSAALLIVLLLLLRRRKRRPVTVKPLSPTEEALREILELLEDDPLGRGELQTFFVALTGIVRRYIERTTRLRAPEQTTEEFLREMRAHPAFDEQSRERLRSFLESADLVKFAAHFPARPDIEESFRRAQDFVGLETALELKSGGAS